MRCDGCKYWSEMVAQAIGGGPVQALCMHDQTRDWQYDKRMVHRGCAEYEAGMALDDPGRQDDMTDDEYNALEEDALREMGLDDVVDFGLDDVGCK